MSKLPCMPVQLHLFEVNLASGRGLLVANWLSAVINGRCCCTRTRSMIQRTLGMASSETVFWFVWVDFTHNSYLADLALRVVVLYHLLLQL